MFLEPLEPQLLDHREASRATPAERNSDLFGDIPQWIWIAFLFAWALLFGLFLVFFTTNGEATFMVMTAAFFALMILGLPAALGAQTKRGQRPGQRIIATRTGPLPVSAAATQILLIPVGAVIGLTAFIILGM